MEWFGFAAFIIMCCYLGYPPKVSLAEKKIKRLEKKLALYERNSRSKTSEGDFEMSEMIKELKGKRCSIKFSESFDDLFNDTVECTVVDADDEWLKLSHTIEKKKSEPRNVTKIVRTDSIRSFEIIE